MAATLMRAIHATHDPSTDRQWSDWMLAARAGDKAAYDALLRSCIPLIRRVARNHGVRAHGVDDVVQDTLLALHRARHSYDPGRSFTGWIKTIAQRRAIDVLRRNGRICAREIYAPLAYENHPDAIGDTAPQAPELDRRVRLEAALRVLSVGQRRTVDLVLGSRSFVRAAAAVGCRPASLRVSWHRALSTLRARMTGSDHP
jgi:RNA polymerase sigma factor (sigma-70 family)